MTAKPRRSRLWWAAVPVLAVTPLLLFLSCKNDGPPPPPEEEIGDPWFKDVTKETGIAQQFDNGQNVPARTFDGKDLLDKNGKPILDYKGKPMGNLAILESLGGGAGLIDYDGDGLYDIFLPGGGTYTGPTRGPSWASRASCTRTWATSSSRT